MTAYRKAGAGLAAAVFVMSGCSADLPSGVASSPAAAQSASSVAHTSLSALAANPLLSTTLDNVAAVMTPAFGTGQGATISTAPANNFLAAHVAKGLLANAGGERILYPQVSGGVQNIELEHGTMDFWYRPNYNHDDNNKYTIVGTGNWTAASASRKGSMHLGKHNNSNHNDIFLIFHDANGLRFEHTVAVARYQWRAGDWLQIKITWDFNVAAGQPNLHLYLNGAELPLTNQVSRGPQLLPAERSSEKIYIGSRGLSTGIIANGMYDDFKIWDRVIPPV